MCWNDWKSNFLYFYFSSYSHFWKFLNNFYRNCKFCYTNLNGAEMITKTSNWYLIVRDQIVLRPNGLGPNCPGTIEYYSLSDWRAFLFFSFSFWKKFFLSFVFFLDFPFFRFLSAIHLFFLPFLCFLSFLSLFLFHFLSFLPLISIEKFPFLPFLSCISFL